MVGVVGPDGAGKTTLLQMCAGILDPSEGTCNVLGFDTVRESKAVAARIGYMSQGFTLYDRLSVEENLSFSAQIRAVTGDSYSTRRARLLEMAGLGAFTDRPAGNLSGGMRKKLSLCTNLVHEPDLLLLDEPGLGRGSAIPSATLGDARNVPPPGHRNPGGHVVHGRGRAL